MTDSPRKTPKHQPWCIYRLTSDDGGTYLEHYDAEEYDSLASCEVACRALAVENVGSTFVAVKRGRSFVASKVEKVVLQ